jgi:hypothetical protein
MKKPVGPIIQPTGANANLVSVNNQGGSGRLNDKQNSQIIS